jgi:dolichol-phosphate mannosyltransferase
MTQPSAVNQTPSIATDTISPGSELCVVLPTFNELDNVDEVITRVSSVLGDMQWEMIFVDDDSPDGTAEAARAASRKDSRVRCIQRIGRRGLSSACIEGMLASSAPYLAVMDADLQHDEKLLAEMVRLMREDAEVDIVIASRYVAGGGIGDWQGDRAAMSSFATRLSRLVLRAELTDPMSGMFMIRRSVLEKCVRNLSGIGFKILVDILASSPEPLRFKEIPYEFRTRHAGESKLDSQAMWDYVMLLLDKSVGHIVPVRFVSFAFIGALGILVHFAVLATMLNFEFSFLTGQTSATLIAMASNFALNNELTYRDMRLRGAKWFKGLISFSLACGIGAIANVGVATYVFEYDTKWFLAALAGIIVGAVWNYAVTMLYTWNQRPRSA